MAPVLGVRDVRATAEYWRDVLGFSLDPRTGVVDGVDADEGAVYALLSRAGTEVHFQIRRREPRPAEREGIETDVYVFVEDVDALHAELAGRGANITQEPRMAPYGIREIRVEDPNGIRTTFGQPGTAD
jgi:uncharacterized glyoxalase superfamily protein PhnB